MRIHLTKQESSNKHTNDKIRFTSPMLQDYILYFGDNISDQHVRKQKYLCFFETWRLKEHVGNCVILGVC